MSSGTRHVSYLSITQCTPTTKFHAYWAQIKSTFKLSNTARTTQKAFSTCLSQPPDTPSSYHSSEYQLSSRPKTCLSCMQEPYTYHQFSTFAPWSNTSVSEDVKPGNLLSTLREFQVTILQQVTYRYFSLPKRNKILRLGTLHPCKHLQVLQRSLALVTLR